MIRRFIVAAAALFALASSAFAAGTVPGFSLTPQFDLTGKVAPGCKLYTIQAGTVSTPQNSYQDSALTILWTNPLVCDASGRLPQFFLADGNIKLRLTKSDGTQIYVGDNLLVVGASSGGGGGGSVDPTTVLTTGDVKINYGTGVLTGFVRMNGRTVGSATSGATERANSDTQALFEYLWTTDASLAVSGGRGVSASADWSANKAITLPDMRGRLIGGLGGMGSSNCSVTCITPTTISNSDSLGVVGGAQQNPITQSNLPNYNLPFSLTWTQASGGLTSGQAVTSVGTSQAQFNAGISPVTSIGLVSPGVTVTGSIGGTVALNGSSSPLNGLPPLMLMTFYQKL